MNKNSKEVLKLGRESRDSNKEIEGLAMLVEETKFNIEDVETALSSLEKGTEACATGHSTPIRSNAVASNVESSPELRYQCSPILLPCTQEGGDEVAWDWHSPLAKSSSGKDRECRTPSDTPKRTNLLHKRRAAKSNSPLLCKPIKRKLIKSKNIESIGKFTAELKALTDRMKKPERRKDNLILLNINDINSEVDSQMFIEMDTKKEEEPGVRLQDTPKKERLDVENGYGRSIDKVDSSFEDFFDDSIDDSMIRCSQEVEERLNLGSNSTENSSNSRERRSSSLRDSDFQYITAVEDVNKNDSNQSNTSVGSTDKRILVAPRSSTERLKKSDSIAVESVKVSGTSNSAAECSRNLCVNIKVETGKKEFVSSQIPDDSFDDCLATCLEVDEKLVCESLEDEEIHLVTNQMHNRYGKVYKNPNAIVQKVNIGKQCNSTASKAPIVPTQSVPVSLKVNIEVSKNGSNNNVGVTSCSKGSSIMTMPSEASITESRKFFKLKSFSDSNFPKQKTISNVKHYAGMALQSRPILKSCSNSNLNSKSCSKSIPRPGAGSSVSTKFSSMQNTNSCQSNNCASLNGNDNARRSYSNDVNGLLPKGDGIFNYKREINTKFHHSTKNVKSNSQPMQCSPEEIERKRLEAKMKLEAKRKTKLNLQKSDVSSSISVRQTVKR